MSTPSSIYREHAPPAALARHVLCTWSQTIGTGEAWHAQRVLPDGCADIVWIGERPPLVAGPATRPVDVPLPPGTSVIGVRLRPGAAAQVLGPPASALADRDTSLGEIWRHDDELLSARITDAAASAARLALAARALSRRLVDAPPCDPVPAAAVAWLARHPQGRIERLAGALDLSGRQLHRRFVGAVGYGPKIFQRVLRLQRLLALAGRPRAERAGLADLAADAGYADQAHMSREVQALAGRRPSALLADARSTLAMSDLFKTGPGPGP